MTRSLDPVDARLAAVHEQLAAGVAALSDSEGWQRMLQVAARFHRYSPNNVLLISVQRPEATLVAGYRSWQQLGRQVVRGERGIAILAPVLVRADSHPDTQAADPARVLRGFRVTHVFDVSQTEGDALPDTGPRLLAGGSPRGLWDTLASQVHDAGFTLDRGHCGAANGYTDHVQHHVRVRADVSSAQACKTLAHELAHVLLHGPDQPTRLRHEAEVEAESVAYVVSTAAGLTTGDYSIPYVTSWSAGSTDVVRDAATRVLSTARLIIDRIGPPADPLEKRNDPRDRTRQLAADHNPTRDLRLAG